MTDSIHSGDYCPDCGEPTHAIYVRNDKEVVVVDAKPIIVWVRIDGIPTECEGVRPHAGTCRAIKLKGVPEESTKEFEVGKYYLVSGEAFHIVGSGNHPLSGPWKMAEVQGRRWTKFAGKIKSFHVENSRRCVWREISEQEWNEWEPSNELKGKQDG